MQNQRENIIFAHQSNLPQMKFVIIAVIILSTCACGKEMPSQTMELYNSFDTIIHVSRQQKIADTLFEQSTTLPAAQRYAIIYKIADFYFKYGPLEKGFHYLHALDSLPFPKIQDKNTGFLLLRQYAKGDLIKKFAPQYIDNQKLSMLLFNMERQQLTPEEKCLLLTYKAQIYRKLFQESGSAIIIASEAEKIATQHEITGQTLFDIYTTLLVSYLDSEQQDTTIKFTNDFLRLIENDQTLTNKKINLQQILSTLCFKQGDYSQSFYWLKKSGKDNPAECFLSFIPTLYLALDSIQLAKDYLQGCRSTSSQSNKCLPQISWNRALISLYEGDTSAYEHNLAETVKFSEYYIEPEDGAPSEAYARLLWQRGQHDKAIRCLESFSRRFSSNRNVFKSSLHYYLEKANQQLRRLHLLTQYYRDAGRTEEALHHALLCDTLQNLYANACLQAEQNKNSARMYSADLQRNLDQRAGELREERQKLWITYFLLALATVGISMLLLAYYRHKRQIDILYTRQKEIECLQEEKRIMISSGQTNLSAEEQLFRELEKQFYNKQLFRNPDFSREDLCRLGGSNRMYVSTCINKYTGNNITHWINKARIDYAIRLICTGENNLQIIAETSGFSSTTSFFRNFKQFTNLTPRQYIERQKHTSANLKEFPHQ